MASVLATALGLGVCAPAQQAFPAGVDLQGSYVEGIGLIDATGWGVDLEHPIVRTLGPSLAQLMGRDPRTGDAITDAANLVPLTTRLLVADVVQARTGDGFGFYDAHGSLLVRLGAGGFEWPGRVILGPAEIARWNAAVAWGDHAQAGYLTHELEPHWSSAQTNYVLLDGSRRMGGMLDLGYHGLTNVAGIHLRNSETFNGNDVQQWRSAWQWGDHHREGYLRTETDPFFSQSVAFGIDVGMTNAWNQAVGWGNHASAGYLRTETDPVFSRSVAAGISAAQTNAWGAANAWGNHATAGYLRTEEDPVFSRSVAAAIDDHLTNAWNAAYGWGDHAAAGYLTEEADPAFAASAASGIRATDITQWATAFGWGNHALRGYLRAETDPLFSASAAAGLTSTAISHWNSAFTWGNHATRGYLTAESDPLFLASEASHLTAQRTASWDAAVTWGNHATAGYLTRHDEADPLFSASVVFGVSETLTNQWSLAYGWGNHATAGYLRSESDPRFLASVAYTITSTQLSHWESAYAWGNHAAVGYLTAESDPQFAASVAHGITSTDTSHWQTAYGWGNHATAGYLTGESDPNYASSPAASISSTLVDRWNTAFAWGDHAAAGYLLAESDPGFAASPASAITSNQITQWTAAYAWGNHAASNYLTTTTGDARYVTRSGGSVSTNLNLAGYHLLGLPSDVAAYTDPHEAVSKLYVDAVAVGLKWQLAVESVRSDPPTSPATGARYLIGDSPSGAWSGEAGALAEFTSGSWSFSAPSAGWAVFVTDVGSSYTFTSLGTWTPFSTATSYSWGTGIDHQGSLIAFDVAWGDDRYALATNAYTRAETAALFLSTESDPFFAASAAAGITTGDVTRWNAAYGWGNHASAGYLTRESDPSWAAAQTNYLHRDGTRAMLAALNLGGYPVTNVAEVRLAAGSVISAARVAEWSSSYAWGNHASAGYLTTESDPQWSAAQTNYLWRDGSRALIGNLNLGGGQVTNLASLQFSDGTLWNSVRVGQALSAYGWGNHASAGYLTSESDPLYTASAAAAVTAGRISNWDAAYGWGNHANAGYLRGFSASSPLAVSGSTTLSLSLPEASASLDGYLSTHDWATFNAKLGGGGSNGFIARFSASGTLTNASVYERGGNVAIGAGTFDENFPEKLKVDAGVTTSYNVISGYGEVDNYLQLNIHNRSSGSSASADLVATADNGDESDNYIDVGINSSGFFNEAFTIGGANDAYVYNMGQNLSLGTGSPGKVVKIHTGGTLAAHERLRIDGEGHVVVGGTVAEPSARLQVDAADQGFLPPRLTEAQRAAISSPAVGLLVYQTDGTDGLYYFDGQDWQGILPSDASAELTGLSVQSPLQSTGGSNPTLTLQSGTVAGQVLRWNGSAWGAGADANTLYSAGTGLALSGATFSVASGGISSTHLAASSVGSTQLASGSVTASKLANGVVVTSLNGLSNAVTLAAGSGIALSTSGTTVTVSASGGSSGDGSGWSLTGNSGTSVEKNFLGTTDAEPMEIHVNQRTALRLEPGSNGEQPNVIGGDASQKVDTSDYGVFIGGGAEQQVGSKSFFVSIVGGQANHIGSGSSYATIGGGTSNEIDDSATASVIAGGSGNRIKGSATYGTIAGGSGNEVSANYGFAAGRRARANHSGAFVWGDSTDSQVSSTTADQFVVRASGGVKFYSNSGTSSGVSLSAGGGSWSSVSDRAQKKDFEEVDTVAILEQLQAIPILRWLYQWEESGSSKHLGPVAQDFKPAFYPGRDETSISTLEFDGVALAAIQGLNQKVEALRAENERLAAQNRALAQQQVEILRRLDSLESSSRR